MDKKYLFSSSAEECSTPPRKRSYAFISSPATPLRQQVLAGHVSRSALKNSPKASVVINSPKIEVVKRDWNVPTTGSPKPKRRPVIGSDRFIPVRPNIDNAHINNTNNNSQSNDTNDPDLSAQYNETIAEACGLDLNTRILAFKPAPPESRKPVDLRAQYNRPAKPVASQVRRIMTTPERVLDAPGIVDDYYLNLLDWSSVNNVAIALESNVYMWNADTGDVAALASVDESTYVAGVKWSQDGAFLGVGLGNGLVEIYDAETCTKLRTMAGHQARVGVMSWDQHILSSGSRSGAIHHHDVRIAQHKVGELLGHNSEVCGLSWRSDGLQLASGGNDNVVQIWDARSSVPRFTKTNHSAAVKALSWCPWQSNLLATGGGTMDKKIHFWNSTTGARVNTIDAGSQVTSLWWSMHTKEIISTHGFPDNNLSIWSYSSMGLVKQVDIPAHDTRVLYSSMSPDGCVLATAASDENLKFWKVYDNELKKKSVVGKTSASNMMIR
ncbi:sleepy Slp1 [Schizosaccharomyces japonicus yFS275]|uniref:Sleepy Slp1 n=1 Tax=Schizosaccharomyces japonicus (strain yFS275 / FY16936) TaxID=402676 RepID=B6JW93_SCHJY|nr:sleepy Slp1 [Schizosaccharomyces japonicus yFS275]EEB05644.1 sleepy Slp1 [Schizosaccharomyces japonicus yFS275]